LSIIFLKKVKVRGVFLPLILTLQLKASCDIIVYNANGLFGDDCMQLYHDVQIGKISIIVQKSENPNFEFNCVSRNWNGFIFVVDGDGEFIDSSGTHKLKKHSVLLLQNKAKYIFRGGKNGIKYITTALELYPANGFEALELPTFLNAEKHPYILKHAEDMLKIWESRSPFYVMEARLLAERILIEIIRIFYNPSTGFELGGRLSPALTYINQNYDKNITNEQLAALCDLSATHFRRLFKEQMKISPMQYRENIRLHWAIKMLESQMFTISEVADNLGYSDIYHFSKVIKRHTGNPPSFYKK